MSGNTLQHICNNFNSNSWGSIDLHPHCLICSGWGWESDCISVCFIGFGTFACRMNGDYILFKHGIKKCGNTDTLTTSVINCSCFPPSPNVLQFMYASVEFEMLPFCLLVTLLLAAFKTQTVWSHFVLLGNHPQSSSFSSFSISCHCGVLGVFVGSLFFSVSSMFSASLNCLLSFPQSGFTGEKHMLTAPSLSLSVLFISGGSKASLLKSSYHFSKLQSSVQRR